jgi:hypothetical protein
MMKRAGLFFMTLGLFTLTALADSPAPSAPNPPRRNIFVWAMGKEPADVAEVELDVLEALAKHNVAGDRASKTFPQGLPASAADAIAQMRAVGCDTLLVLRRRSAVDWETPSKERAYSSLQAFLNHRSQFSKPKNAAEIDANVPIEVPNTYGNTVMEIVKGEGIMFDLLTEKDIWRGDTQVKSAKDLPQSDYYKLVADKVASSLTSVGLIPPVKK